MLEPIVAEKFTYGGEELDKNELADIITETVEDATENS